jgi:glycosyltransferase involved in cell wall biosynthesis
MSIRVLMLGPFPRSLSRIDGGVAAATTYLSQALASHPDIELIGVRLAGRAVMRGSASDLGWPVVNFDLGRFGVSTMFYAQRHRFQSLLGRYRPDLIHSQGADASGYLAVRSGYPAIVTVHGILTECANLRSSMVWRLRERAQAWITEGFVVERASNVIAISPYVSRHYQGRLRGKVFDIPNAIAPSYFRLHRCPDPGRVLFAGRITSGKGIADLVQAIARLPATAYRVVLAGAEPDVAFASTLRALISSSGLEDRVTFRGLLGEQDMLDEFARASVLVLPSYQETAPMVIQQAMAARLPVIATRVGGSPDLIEHDVSGLLFETGNIVGLSRELLRLRHDPDLGIRLADSAHRKAVDSFGADQVGRATLAAYKEVLKAACRPSNPAQDP